MIEVAITGLGAVAPHGDDVPALFDALMAGRSVIAPVFPELSKPACAASVHFDATRWFTKLQLPGVDRVSQIAVAAAGLALADAGLPPSAGAPDGAPHGTPQGTPHGTPNGTRLATPHAAPRDLGVDPERVGVYVGCGMGGAHALDAAYGGMNRGGARVPPLTIPAFMPNAPAAHVAMRHGALGPVLTYSVACASSAVALAEAAKAVQAGDIDLAIVGGSEALIVPGVVVAWQAMQTLAAFTDGEAARCVRPFAADRSGFALGEGAAFLILEPAARARARGARIRALLAGWGLSCDATHLTKPDVGGQWRALRQALRRADLAPRDVGYCNAHGTATRIGDVVECEALRGVWGGDIDALHVSSTKALHGHLLGAGGALEALITVMALQRRQLPPNAHCAEADPACAVQLVPASGRAAPRLEAAISNSFAFGGTNAVLAFRRA